MPDWRVHLGIGAATGTAVWFVSGEPFALPVAMAASLVPDIDQPGSYIARRALPFIPQRRFQKWEHVKHRGAWHYQVTAYAAALTMGIAIYHFLPMLINSVSDLMVRVHMGQASHILFDHIDVPRLALALAIATGAGWSSHGLADHAETRRKKIIRTIKAKLFRQKDFKAKLNEPHYSAYEHEDWA